ncbi:Aste57867_18790 [Aphanomyces stellatus]|uniref:Aste57867_18790 protein n=1 Tax=Aphanomyces stellatus TaxID=120398 RepID=A0A485LCX8_9STRA|nr:hypothetical protein As57867_018726 [Aphanomyces stellatus]VFT95524.1 Aste57867_18790 [Aphanomyces stellatus]
MTTTTPSLALTYFGLPGRAELTRLLLAYGNVPFTDTRMTYPEFVSQKSSLTLPFGQLPTLQVNNSTTYGQSMAMARYAAKLVGLYPSDPLLALEADAIVDAIVECYDATFPLLFGDLDDDVRHAKFTQLNTAVFPRALANLEKVVKGPFFTGPTATFADLYLLDLMDNLLGGFPDKIQVETTKYTKLHAIATQLRTCDQLKAYFEAKGQRP